MRISCLSMHLALAAALACAVQAQDQPNQSQSQSLGDVAKANRQKKASAKVIDEDALAQRRLQRGAGNPALQCDEACTSEVRNAIEKDPRLRMSDAQWQNAFVSGQNDLAGDSDWSQLFTEIQQNVCHRGTSAADPEKIKDLDHRVASKVIDEVRETMTIANHPTQPNTSKAVENEAIAAEQSKAVKLLIVKVQVDRAKKACLAPAVQKTPVPN